MKTNIQVDFQICISVPLITLSHILFVFSTHVHLCSTSVHSCFCRTHLCSTCVQSCSHVFNISSLVFSLVFYHTCYFSEKQVFSCEYCKNFKNSYFYRTPPVAASIQYRSNITGKLVFKDTTKACRLCFEQVILPILNLHVSSIVY